MLMIADVVIVQIITAFLILLKVRTLLWVTPLYGADATSSKLKMKASDFCVSFQVAFHFEQNLMLKPSRSLSEGIAPKTATGRRIEITKELKTRKFTKKSH